MRQNPAEAMRQIALAAQERQASLAQHSVDEQAAVVAELTADQQQQTELEAQRTGRQPIPVLVGQLALERDGTVGRADSLPDEAKEVALTRPRVTAEDITNSYKTQRFALRNLAGDDLVLAECEAMGIDETDPKDQRRYWGVVAKHARKQIAEAREMEGDSLELRTLELLAAVPEAMFEWRASTASEKGSGRGSKVATSKLNALIRSFGTDFRDTSASDMSVALSKTAAMALEPGDVVAHVSTAQWMKNVVRGAQHEAGLGQLVAATGREYRQSTVEEDGKGGDLILKDKRGRPLYLDAKASLSNVEARGSERAYVVRSDNKIIMYSMLRDSEFNDRFYVSDEVVEQRAPIVARMLEEAEADIVRLRDRERIGR